MGTEFLALLVLFVITVSSQNLSSSSSSLPPSSLSPPSSSSSSLSSPSLSFSSSSPSSLSPFPSSSTSLTPSPTTSTQTVVCLGLPLSSRSSSLSLLSTAIYQIINDTVAAYNNNNNNNNSIHLLVNDTANVQNTQNSLNAWQQSSCSVLLGGIDSVWLEVASLSSLPCLFISTSISPANSLSPYTFRIAPSIQASVQALFDIAVLYSFNNVSVVVSNDAAGQVMLKQAIYLSSSRKINLFQLPQYPSNGSWSSSLSSAPLSFGLSIVLVLLSPSFVDPFFVLSQQQSVRSASSSPLLWLYGDSASSSTYVGNAASPSSSLPLPLPDNVVLVKQSTGPFKRDRTFLYQTYQRAFGPGVQYDLTLSYANDAIVAIGKALNQLTAPYSPSSFISSLRRLSFLGSSGPIQFQSSSNERSSVFYDVVQVSSPSTRVARWSSLEGLLLDVPGVGFNSTVLNNNQITINPVRATKMNSLMTNQWISLPIHNSPPAIRYGACVAVSDVTDTVYVIFGTLSSGATPYDDIFSFSLVTQTWSRIPVLGIQPDPRFYGSCLINGDFIYLYGGTSPTGVKGDLWQFQLSTSTWHQLSMPVALLGHSQRSQFGFSSSSKELVIVAGRHRPTLSGAAEIWIYSVLNNQWTVTVPLFSTTELWPPYDQAPYPPDVINFNTYPVVARTNINNRDSLIIVGGYLLQTCNISYIYDFASNTVYPLFTTGTSIPTSRSLVTGAISSDNFFWMSHGWDETLGINYPEIWSLDLNCPSSTCGTWLLRGSYLDSRDSTQLNFIGTDLFLFGGWGAMFIHNDMALFNSVTNTALTFTSDYTSPPARVHHSVVMIGTQIVMFAGRATTGPRNDLWFFDTEYEVWSTSPALGTPPSPRYGHSASVLALQMIIFGGTDGVSYFNDLNVYSIFTNQWSLISPTVTVGLSAPVGRAFHSAVNYQDNFIIVQGGVDKDLVLLSGVWVFTQATYNWTTLSADLSGDVNPCTASPLFPSLPSPVSQAAAVISTNSLFFLIGGWDAGYNSLNNVWSLNVSGLLPVIPPFVITSNWSLNSGIASQNACGCACGNPSLWTGWMSMAPIPFKGLNAISASILLDTIYVYGGTYYDVVTSAFFSYSISSNQWTSILGAYASSSSVPASFAPSSYYYSSNTQMPGARAASASVVYGNYLFLVGGASSQFPSVYTESYMLNDVWKFVLPVSSSAPCTPGTFFNFSQTPAIRCDPCALGSYQPSFSSSVCVACPRGFFGNVLGSSSSAGCLPCNRGTFAPNTGMSQCLPCNSSNFCPIGSPSPLPLAAALLSGQSLFNQSQPSPLASQAAMVENAVTIASFVLLAVTCATCVLYVCFVCSGMGETLRYLDKFFTYDHFHELDQPMYRRQTHMGGICTLLGVFLTIYFIVTLALPYLQDNLIESRSLIPNVSNLGSNAITIVTSNLLSRTKLVGYPNNCVAAPFFSSNNNTVFQGPCTAGIAAQIVSPSGSSLPHTTENTVCQAEVPSPNSNLQQNCTVIHSCSNCTFTIASFYINFVFLESSSFASGIEWSLESPAGYENPSIIFGSIYSPSNFLLRGQQNATTITASFTPTYRLFSYSNDLSSGYLLNYKQSSLGQTILPAFFHSQNGVNVQFVVTLTEYTLEVIVNRKQTLVQFIAALLGSITGALAGLAAVMYQAEVFEEFLFRRMKLADQSSQGRLRKTRQRTKHETVKAAVYLTMGGKANFNKGGNGKKNSRERRRSIEMSLSSSPPLLSRFGTYSSSSSNSINLGVPTPTTPTMMSAAGDMSITFDSNVSEDAEFKQLQLTSDFKGAKDLEVPRMLTGSVGTVTLPSRLKTLGRSGFSLLAGLDVRAVGNSMVGVTYSFNFTTKHWEHHFYVLPFFFNKSMVRMWLAIRILLFLLLTLFFLSYFYEVSIGYGWIVGITFTLVALFSLGFFKRAPDGTMSFLRSLGAPEIEEYMFSYCWKNEAEEIRTIAKAVWAGGVGVWIDVVKLCPGDEIRPMLRTMIARVLRVVVFLSPEYCASPNCCIEMQEAIQHPHKLIICIVKPVDKGIMKFVRSLQGTNNNPGAFVVHSMSDLIHCLDFQIQNREDERALKWWRKQKISGAGIPNGVVPADLVNIPPFSLRGALFLPDQSVFVGPLYIAGDCLSQGISVKLPWMFVLAFIGLCITFDDLYVTWSGDQSVGTNTTGSHVSNIDYAFLVCICFCSLIPFLGMKNLFETRFHVTSAVKPLLASKAVEKGIKVSVIGSDEDTVAVNIRAFLSTIGHLKAENEGEEELVIDDEEALNKKLHLQRQVERNAHLSARVRSASMVSSEAFVYDHIITVYVMNSIESRDALFGSEDYPFDRMGSVFIWTGAADPFTKDDIGNRMMKFLILVQKWENAGLANSLFGAIGIRVVDKLHVKAPSAASPSSPVNSVRHQVGRQLSRARTLPPSSASSSSASSASSAAAAAASSSSSSSSGSASTGTDNRRLLHPSYATATLPMPMPMPMPVYRDGSDRSKRVERSDRHHSTVHFIQALPPNKSSQDEGGTTTDNSAKSNSNDKNNNNIDSNSKNTPISSSSRSSSPRNTLSSPILTRDIVVPSDEIEESNFTSNPVSK